MKTRKGGKDLPNGWQDLFLSEYRRLFSITIAAEKAGVSRRTVYAERDRNPEFREAMEDIREKAIDIAENALLKAIEEGNVTAIIFFLKTQAKHRGYTEMDFNAQSNNVRVEFVLPRGANEISK